ncbi:MAG: ATP-binding protein [Myxococcota bacterium]|nr:ATP-binding protein [Myxococcota bacterium]
MSDQEPEKAPLDEAAEVKIPEIDPGARALREAVSASITPTASLLAALYGLLAFIHPFILTGDNRWVMSLLAAFSSFLSAAIAIGWRRNPRQNQAHMASFVLAGIALVNTVVHFALFRQAVNTTNFVVLILGIGFVMLSRVSFYSMVALALAAWATIVARFDVPEPSEWGWFLFFAAFAGGILEEQRIHATRASGMRVDLLLQRSQVLQDLVKAPALSDTNVRHVLNLISEAARVNLAASSVTIWLIEGDKHVLQPVASDRKDAAGHHAPLPTTLTLDEEFTRRLFESRTVTSLRDPYRLSGGSRPRERGPDRPTLYAGIISSRNLAGVIVIEREPIDTGWTLEDQMFAASIADLANLALQTRQRIALEGQARKAEHLESLGVLAGGVAHDFNNLLTVILGNIELMQESETNSSETKTSLESMMEASVRARDLAQQMLAYAGRAHRQTQTIDLAAFGSEIDQDWAHDLLEGIEVIFDIDREKVLAVDVDPTQIRQVILNLLTNARDSGASQITISVGSESDLELSSDDSILANPEYHWLMVADNGSGMAPSEIERIFEPFYTTRETGTGLGLAASRGIMRAHLGALTVESELNRGSQFRMLLPHSSNTPETISTEALGQLISVREKTKVLLIEDEALVARLTTTLLKQSGRQVQWLDSLAAFQDELPAMDLDQIEFALIDVTLGDGSGLDAATLIRKRQPNLPIILVSGYDARNVLQDQRVGDSFEFLSKPFSRGGLQASIDNAIARIGAPPSQG